MAELEKERQRIFVIVRNHSLKIDTLEEQKTVTVQYQVTTTGVSTLIPPVVVASELKFLPWLRVCWCPAVEHEPSNVEVKDMSVEMALVKECEGVFVREWGCPGAFNTAISRQTVCDRLRQPSHSSI